MKFTPQGVKSLHSVGGVNYSLDFFFFREIMLLIRDRSRSPLKNISFKKNLLFDIRIVGTIFFGYTCMKII